MHPLTEEVERNVLGRQAYLGGSDIGALLGINPYKTRLDLYREKIGDVIPMTGNAHTKRGQKLEEAAAQEYMEQHGCRVIRSHRPLIHPSYPYLRGHIDRKILLRNRIAEIKCPSLGSFSKIKREGLRADYIAQMQWYLGLSEAEGGTWIIFCADQWELLQFDVEPEPQLYAQMVEAATRFWNDHVIPRIPPEDDERDRAVAAELHSVGDTRIMRTDAEFVAAMDLLHEAKRLKAEAETIEETAVARVKELIEEKPGCYEGPGYRLYLREQKGRTSFDKAALAKNRPLDRLKVGAVLMPLLQNSRDLTQDEIEATIKEVGACDIDLAQFEKQGKPFTTLRSYFFGGE